MIILQGVPPPPPTPPFDPNLIFMNQGGPPLVLLIVIAALTATVIILWPIMRAFGRRLEGRGVTDPTLQSDVEHLHARLADVDTLQARVAELEERVDFAERILLKSHDRKEVGQGESAG